MVKAHVGKSIARPTNGADKLGICLQENEIRIRLSTLYKKKSKWVKYFNLKPKAMKIF